MFREDLRDWFRERWVNLAKKKKSGGYEECGTSGEKKGYAKCVPAKKAASMSKQEITSAVKRKRAAQRKAGRPGKSQPGQGNKPIMVKTFKEHLLIEKNTPSNPKLWSRAKSLARSKFDVYPSAYANAWAAKWYKKQGGGWGSVKETFDVTNPEVAPHFNTTLNPAIWDGMELRPEVRRQLLSIAYKFMETWEIEIPLHDIILTGSNANYNWTKYSDLDLHVVVNIPSDNTGVFEKYLRAKKDLFNKKHAIKLYGYSVEVYAQNVTEDHRSTGQYSILRDNWLVVPYPQRASVDTSEVQRKAADLIRQAEAAIAAFDWNGMMAVLQKIVKMRRSGLQQNGEYSIENMTFKVLRNTGLIEKLRLAIDSLEDKQLSLEGYVAEAKTAAWQRKEGKDPEGGLNRKGIASYRRENPGSKLSMAVTTKPSKLDPNSKKAKRRKRFCARMTGMKERLTSTKKAKDPDSRINKSLRKWNC
jgi:hypothetical protein